jgi:hypothetical protein
MSVLPGHEDLRSKAILGFDSMGFALVQSDDDPLGYKRYRMFVGPGGRLHAEPHDDKHEHTVPDQLQAKQQIRARLYDQTM